MEGANFDMTHTTLTVPPEVLEESGIDLEAILQFTAVDGKITIEQLEETSLISGRTIRRLRKVEDGNVKNATTSILNREQNAIAVGLISSQKVSKK